MSGGKVSLYIGKARNGLYHVIVHAPRWHMISDGFSSLKRAVEEGTKTQTNISELFGERLLKVVQHHGVEDL